MHNGPKTARSGVFGSRLSVRNFKPMDVWYRCLTCHAHGQSRHYHARSRSASHTYIILKIKLKNIYNSFTIIIYHRLFTVSSMSRYRIEVVLDARKIRVSRPGAPALRATSGTSLREHYYDGRRVQTTATTVTCICSSSSTFKHMCGLSGSWDMAPPASRLSSCGYRWYDGLQ